MTNTLALPNNYCAPLQEILHKSTSEVRMVRRAVAVEKFWQTKNMTEAAEASGYSIRTAQKWCDRYATSGLKGLSDLPRSGRPCTHDSVTRLALTALATTDPPTPYTIWTYALLAQQLGVEGYGVSEKWCKTTLETLEINPTKVQGWISRPTDPKAQAEFASRAADVCETLLHTEHNPLPGKGNAAPKEVTFCLDEKTSIPARSPTLPDRLAVVGSVRQHEHEYQRHGVTHLQGAYNHSTGQVLHMFCKSNNTVAFITFVLYILSVWAPHPTTVVHLVLDNGSSHVSKAARGFFLLHPRIKLHYTPVHASWLNPAELIFSKLQRQVIKYGSWESVEKLQESISRWYQLQNENPTRIKWRYRWGDPPKKAAKTSAVEH